MSMGEGRLSASLGTIDRRPEATGTRRTSTGQGAFREGREDAAMREAGSRFLPAALAAEGETAPR